MEKYTPTAVEFEPEGKHFFLEIVDFFFVGAAKLRWAGGGARSAPLGVAMSTKRRVRAVDGRARAAKTH